MFVEKFKAGRVAAGTVLMAIALGLAGCGSTVKEDPNSRRHWTNCMQTPRTT